MRLLDSILPPAPPLKEPVPLEVMAAAALAENRLGRYVRVAMIGRGGMGEVWKAWDLELARWVAMKFTLVEHPRDLERLRREARAAARLSHPNIAAVYELGQAQGRTFIAMQYIDGRTLAETPRDDRRALVAAFRDAVRGVAHAHAGGLLHRDLKPGNLMVASTGQAYVLDFGLSRPMGSIRTASLIAGTPYYMSPEQALGGRVDARSDVWSLGATLYELLSGRPPFVGDTPLEVLNRIARDLPPPLAGVDADLSAVVGKCLERRADLRYADARELAEDLDRYLAGEDVHARRTLFLRRLRRFATGRMRSPALVAGALALALALAWTLWHERDAATGELREEERARLLSAVFYELSLKTYEPMRELEKSWRRAPADAAAALNQVESTTRAVERAYPGNRLPAAWRGLARFLARDPQGWEDLRAACEESPEDPFSHILAARSRLLLYVNLMALHKSPWIDDSCPPPFEETDVMRECRTTAAALLGKALAMPVLSRLTHGREYQRFAEGLHRLSAAEYRAAEERFRETLSEPMVRDESLLFMGLSQYLGSDYGGAASTWDRLKDRWGPMICLWISVALELQARRDPGPEAIRLLSRAIDSCKEAEARGRDRATCLQRLALLLLSKGRLMSSQGQEAGEVFDAAIQHLTSLIEARLDVRRHCNGRGLAYMERADGCTKVEDKLRFLDAAIADFTKADVPGPEGRMVRHNRGNALVRKAGFVIDEPGDRPVPWLRQALTDLEGSLVPESRMVAGDALRMMMSKSKSEEEAALLLLEALRQFEQAKEGGIDPVVVACKRGHVRLSWAWRLARRDKATLEAVAEVLADLEEVRESDPRVKEVHLLRGTALYLRANIRKSRGEDAVPDLEAALTHFTKASTERFCRPDALVNRGTILLQLNRPTEAVGALEEALDLKPDSAFVRAKLQQARALVQ